MDFVRKRCRAPHQNDGMAIHVEKELHVTTKQPWLQAKWGFIAAGAVMVGGLGLTSASAGQAAASSRQPRVTSGRPAPLSLFTAVPEDRVKQTPVREPGTLRRRFVAVDVDELFEPRRRGERSRRPRRQLRIALFDGASVDARLVQMKSSARGRHTWFGYIPSEEIGDVILTVVDGVMMGTVHVGADVYHLRALNSGIFELMQIDVDELGGDADELARKGDVNDLLAVDANPPVANPARAGARGRRNFRKNKRPFVIEHVGPTQIRTITDSGGRIDIMVAYTTDAKVAAATLTDSNGDPIPTATDIHTAIQHSMDKANYVIQVSGVPTFLNIVHTVELKDPEPDVSPATMIERMNSGDDWFEELLPLGDEYHADLTSLIVEGKSNFDVCGKGRHLPQIITPEEQSYTSEGRGQMSAFGKNVVRLRCGVRGFTLIHEIGHNSGLNHDWYVDQSTNPVEAGHGFVMVPVLRRTVMAYNDLCADFLPEKNCPRLPRLSDPLASYQGWPLGMTGGPFIKPVNAVDAMIQTLWTVANFRHSLISP